MYYYVQGTRYLVHARVRCTVPLYEYDVLCTLYYVHMYLSVCVQVCAYDVGQSTANKYPEPPRVSRCSSARAPVRAYLYIALLYVRVPCTRTPELVLVHSTSTSYIVLCTCTMYIVHRRQRETCAHVGGVSFAPTGAPGGLLHRTLYSSLD